ncbi:MAG TPA: SIMPL domain-containing protein [Gemmatimonadaceae bacterium]
MRNSLCLVGVIAVSFVGAPVLRAQAPATPPAPSPQIVVTGTGQASVAPDRATIYIGVQTRAATAAAAGAENARRQRAILDTLRKVGVGSDQLSTTNYNVSPEMQYSPTGQTPPKVTGYVVSNSVRVELRQIEDIARVIDAALAKGANEISSLQLYSSKADSVRRAALSGAVADARADAEALALAAGGRLGQLLELSSVEPTIRPITVMMAPKAAAAERTPIEAGQQTVSATVTARWAFLAGR